VDREVQELALVGVLEVLISTEEEAVVPGRETTANVHGHATRRGSLYSSWNNTWRGRGRNE
jgi:hypothetical protein